MSSADDHNIPGDNRCGVKSDFGAERIDRLVVVLLQIDDAVVAKRPNAVPGLRIQGDQAVPGSHVENPLVVAVGPVRQPASGQLPRCGCPSRPFTLAVRPEQLSSHRVQRDDRAACAACGIKDAVDHQRRGFELSLRAGAQVIGLEAPGDFEPAEVLTVDLVEWRVTRVTKIAAVSAPLPVFGPGLSAHACAAAGKKENRENPHDTRCVEGFHACHYGFGKSAPQANPHKKLR